MNAVLLDRKVPVSDHRWRDVICFLDNAIISGKVNGGRVFGGLCSNLFSCRAEMGEIFMVCASADAARPMAAAPNPASISIRSSTGAQAREGEESLENRGKRENGTVFGRADFHR
ncbi:hypothetical protein KYK30_25945 [Shinella yambaruensis]|uniref:hypothetical protein n=1 Tax=Shinella yambaruensis TaxID=415996 RepID=UPI001FD087E3|nr:hypothetical protein [Shinella yambaruensis]MCJ8027704.1 hypothetical protein [Shinella yambaruensis]MCU7983154.1 hypothetical protein [Shinella yambaruensis]